MPYNQTKPNQPFSVIFSQFRGHYHQMQFSIIQRVSFFLEWSYTTAGYTAHSMLQRQKGNEMDMILVSFFQCITIRLFLPVYNSIKRKNDQTKSL